MKKSKNFISKSFFLYDGVKNWPPPNLGFWNFAMKYFQNILAIFFRKTIWCKFNSKTLKEDGSSKKIKKFYF